MSTVEYPTLHRWRIVHNAPRLYAGLAGFYILGTVSTFYALQILAMVVFLGGWATLAGMTVFHTNHPDDAPTSYVHCGLCENRSPARMQFEVTRAELLLRIHHWTAIWDGKALLAFVLLLCVGFLSWPDMLTSCLLAAAIAATQAAHAAHALIGEPHCPCCQQQRRRKKKTP